MNTLLNNRTLTETQKNALFAFGELNKTGTGVNLMIAASMCEGELTKAILMNLSDLVESVGITDEEFEQLIYQIRLEAAENIMNVEKRYQEKGVKKSDDFSWRGFARKKILATFGNERIGTTFIRLSYVEYVTVDPDLKHIIHDLTSQIATMNVFHPEKYPEFLAESQKVDDHGYFTEKE